MVSFSCEVCNDTIIKKKLDQHTQRCYGAYFTCIDCSTTFEGTEYRKHTSCITEDEKYQKSLYKKKPVKKPQPKEKAIVPETKPEKTKSPLENITGSKNLYKIVKQSSKDGSKSLKEILKSMEVTETDGKYELTFIH